MVGRSVGWGAVGYDTITAVFVPTLCELGWADGPATLSRTFLVGTSPQTFTAIYQNQAPSAVAVPGSASGTAPLTVVLDGGSSTDPEGDQLQYAWDAGPAGTSTDVSPSFTFTAPGDYGVSLVVTDQLGAAGSALVAVSVAPSGPACSDGLDNDGDGFVDYPEDPGCRHPTTPSESTECQDGIDNDGVPGIDFDGGQSIHGACTGGACPPGVSDPEGDGVANPDPQCLGTGWRNREAPVSACGLGLELLLLAPLALRLLRLRSARR